MRAIQEAVLRTAEGLTASSEAMTGIGYEMEMEADDQRRSGGYFSPSSVPEEFRATAGYLKAAAVHTAAGTVQIVANVLAEGVKRFG